MTQTDVASRLRSAEDFEDALDGAIDTETASFDEPAFQANLERMLRRERG